MIIIRFLMTAFPQEIGASYVLCGVAGITLYNEHDQELMYIPYDKLISMHVE